MKAEIGKIKDDFNLHKYTKSLLEYNTSDHSAPPKTQTLARSVARYCNKEMGAGMLLMVFENEDPSVSTALYLP